MKIPLTRGLRNNTIVNIKDVVSGLACDCKCPACGEGLIAVKGVKLNSPISHFRHKSLKDCKYVHETTIHLLAKDIIEEAKEIVLPIKILKITTLQEIVNGHKYNKPMGKVEFQTFKLDEVILEKKLHNIVPDIIATIKGNCFIIEIAVTSFVKEEKANKIEEIGLPVLEIDLSNIYREIEESSLREILIESYIRRNWIFNLRNYAINEYLRENSKYILEIMVESIETKHNYGYKKEPKITNCPKEYNTFDKRRHHRNYKDCVDHFKIINSISMYDCKECNYLWEYNLEYGYIQCFGSSMDDIYSEYRTLNKNIESVNKGINIKGISKFKASDYLTND